MQPRSPSSIRLGRRAWLALAAASALLLAACATETQTPGAVTNEAGAATEPGGAVATDLDPAVETEIVIATEGLPGTAGVEVTPAVGTEPAAQGTVDAVVTPATPEAENTNVLATPALELTAEALATQLAGTPGAEATAVGTPGAEGTAGAATTPVAGEAPVLARSTALIGADLVGADGEMAGVIEDVLFDPQTGSIRYLLVSLPAAEAERVKAVEWAAVEPDVAQEQLRLSSQAGSLAEATDFDLAAIDADAIVIDTAGTGLPEAMQGLMRATQLAEVSLTAEPAAGGASEPLAEVEELLFDVRGGRLGYAIADISGLAGGPAEDVLANVAIPWAQLSVPQDTAQLAVERELVLDVTADTLTNAPRVSLAELPMWLDTGDGDLSDLPQQWNSYWEDAA